MDILRAGTQPSHRGASEHFSGGVWRKLIIEAPSPARVRSGLAEFEPRARTAWHTHPLGQTLYILSGIGLVQSWGGDPREVRAGDVVWIPPLEKHWHGASPTSTMSYIATQEDLGGEHVTWLEHVTDEQYNRATRA